MTHVYDALVETYFTNGRLEFILELTDRSSWARCRAFLINDDEQVHTAKVRIPSAPRLSLSR